MSDYEQSRYARATHPVETGGASAFWVLVVVVALGALVLIMAVGGATGPIEPATGADAAGETAPAVTSPQPSDPAAGTTAE